MDQATFLWTIAATIFAGIQLFFQKVVAEEKRNSAYNGLLMYALSAVPAFILQFSLYSIPDRWLLAGLFGFAGGAIHATGNYVRIEALKYIDSVLYFPINKVLGPLLVIIGGILIFSDHLTVREGIGIAFAMCVPLLLVSSAEHHRQKNLRRGLIFVVVSTLFTSISVVVIKEALIEGPAVLFILGMSQFGGAISSAAILFRQKGLNISALVSDARRDIHLGVITGGLGFLAAFTLLMALNTGLISIVYVIHAHYILIPILLSVWWYKDHINLRKLLAVGVSFLAIALLYS